MNSCQNFSSSVMRPSRSLTRASIGALSVAIERRRRLPGRHQRRGEQRDGQDDNLIVAAQCNVVSHYNNLGVALGNQGLVKEAIEAFRKAVAIDPSNASAVRNLARAIEVFKGGSP